MKAALFIMVSLAAAAGCRGTREKPPPMTDAGGASAESPPITKLPLDDAGAVGLAPDVAALAAHVRPSIVTITSVFVSRGTRESFVPFFGFGAPVPGPRRSEGLGSGFVVDTNGHIVTNAHVVENATRVRVHLADDRELAATVLGRDPLLDLAVLSVAEGSSLTPVALGSSERVRVGQYAIAAGNPLGLGHTFTMGIVSAKGRVIGAGPYDDFIQTDASINPGNSGGPLFDVRGEVIGINTAIAASAQGIGFAVPVDALKHVLPELIEKGVVERARLGVVFQPLDARLAEAFGLERPQGALVTDVERGGPAERAGLRSGDVIVAIDGSSIDRAADLPRRIAEHDPGAKITLDVRRRGAKEAQKIVVILGELEVRNAGEDANRRGLDPQEEAVRPSGLGISVTDAPTSAGAMVARIEPGSPAADALRAGDIVQEVDGERVRDARELVARVKNASGKVIVLRVRRGQTSRYVAVPRP